MSEPNATRPYRSRLQSGFTLVELVIAIGILTLIMSVGYSALSQIIKSKQILDDGRDASLIADAVLLRLTRELQLIYSGGQGGLMPPPDKVDSPRLLEEALIGEGKALDNGQPGDSITFLAMEGGQYLPDGGTHSGVVQIAYRVAPDPEQPYDQAASYYLVREETPYQEADFQEAYKKTMVFPVCARLSALEFQYYNAEKEEWLSSWSEEQKGKLPSLIRFSLAIKSPSGKTQIYSTAVPVRAGIAAPKLDG